MSIEEALAALDRSLTPSPETVAAMQADVGRLCATLAAVPGVEQVAPVTLIAEDVFLGTPLRLVVAVHGLFLSANSLEQALAKDQSPRHGWRFEPVVVMLPAESPRELLEGHWPLFDRPLSSQARLVFALLLDPKPKSEAQDIGPMASPQEMSKALGLLLGDDPAGYAEVRANALVDLLLKLAASFQGARWTRVQLLLRQASYQAKRGAYDRALRLLYRLYAEQWHAAELPVPARAPLPRITQVLVEGMRSVRKCHLDVDGLTVLVGANGSGKSTLVEACELLRRMASPNFLDELHSIHGGAHALLRHGSTALKLGLVVDDGDLPLRYTVMLEPQGGALRLTREQLTLTCDDDPTLELSLLDRWASGARLLKGDTFTQIEEAPEGLLLTAYGRQPPHPEMARVLAALQGIEVHTPFEVLPTWVGRAHHRTSALRGSTMIQATRRLERLGLNLANAWHALRTDQGEAHWQETMELVRLGLGDHVESVNTRADAAGGEIALWVKLRGRDAQVPAAGLSEGMLSYLAFVALYRLPTPRSLLVFDEPELHLHPHLLVRVVDFFQSLSEQVPVVLSTHARRLLDALHDPVASVRVCELDPQGDTVLRGLDPDAMARWLESYEGLGRILDAGYEAEVLQALEAS